MNTKPILLNTEMVRAAWDGRKTQTRRVVKPQPVNNEDDAEHNSLMFVDGELSKLKAPTGFGPRSRGWLKAIPYPCPYGQPGDLLWVRETWKQPTQTIIYKANYAIDSCAFSHGPWKSPIHMPRWASRLTLRITNVRVERVQEITYQDAKAEGTPIESTKVVTNFHTLWNSINGPDAWDRNDWVWVIEFEVIKQNVDDVID